MEKKNQILKAFEEAGKPLRPGEIAEISGVDKDEVSKLIKELKKEELVYSPKRCYYDVKK